MERDDCATTNMVREHFYRWSLDLAIANVDGPPDFVRAVEGMAG